MSYTDNGSHSLSKGKQQFSEARCTYKGLSSAFSVSCHTIYF